MDIKEWFASTGLVSVIVMQHGKPVLTLGQPHQNHLVQSVRKSLIGALYGIAVDEGTIDLNARLSDLDIDDSPPLTEREASATVRDLLGSRSGVYLPAPGPNNNRHSRPTLGRKGVHWLYAPRPARGAHGPGEHWYYSNWDFNVLGRIYEQLTGKCVFLAFDRLVAQRIGMRDFDPYVNGTYRYWRDYLGATPRFACYQFELSAHDMALFGQLYLQGGRWGDAQIVPAQWVQTSTTAVSATDLTGSFASYGLMWWVGSPRQPGTVAADCTAYGAFGHYIGLLRELDAVVVAHSDSSERCTVTEDDYEDLVRMTHALLSKSR